MKYAYYQRSKLHLLSIIQKLKQHLHHKPEKDNDATFDHVAERLKELDKAVQCLDHRLSDLKAVPAPVKQQSAASAIYYHQLLQQHLKKEKQQAGLRLAPSCSLEITQPFYLTGKPITQPSSGLTS